MNANNRRFRFQSSQQSFIAVAVTAVLAVAISVYYLSLDRFIVFQNLFYFPIIISCIYYLKRGFVFSVFLSCLYFLLIVTHTADSVILIQALVRVILFIAVAGVVTFLSMHRQRAEEILLETNRQLESEVEEREKAEEEKENLISELQKTLAELKILRGILPICSFCKKIRNEKGYWEQVDIYVRQHSNAEFSHSVCPECVDKHYPSFGKKTDGSD
jgi:hypothetical protein